MVSHWLRKKKTSWFDKLSCFWRFFCITNKIERQIHMLRKLDWISNRRKQLELVLNMFGFGLSYDFVLLFGKDQVLPYVLFQNLRRSIVLMFIWSRIPSTDSPTKESAPTEDMNTQLTSSYWCQFHHHFTCAFFVLKFCAKFFLHLHLRVELFFGVNALIKCWWN